LGRDGEPLADVDEGQFVMEAVNERIRVDEHIPMSYAEFLDQIGEDVHAEWVNGEAIVFGPPNTRHQTVVILLAALLTNFVRYFQLGRVLVAPYEMKIAPEGNSREPDILYIANANAERITDKRLDGPADLLVEVISDSSVARDRSDKFYEYQAAGVREYWIIDPRAGYERVDFWVLDPHGRYRPVPVDDGIYRSTVIPDFWLNVHWLWTEDAPDPIRAFVQIIGSDRLSA
jgi:Uma2 family endonuclease